LMDMGFISQIHSILEIIPRKRQNLLFSATMSGLVKKIAGDFMEFPTVINIEPEKKTASTVSQEVYYVPNFKTKLNLLKYLLQDEKIVSKIILFCKTKKNVTAVHEHLKHTLSEDSIRLIHGNKEQQTRINAMSAFRGGNIRLLITTDVAARGLDIPDVSHVINFDVPLIYEDYIHRIGRTGRALKSGVSITFCNAADEYHLKKIQNLIRQDIPVKKIPSEVFIEKTPYEENQMMARDIDNQKRKENPDYQGAFHEKSFSHEKRR
jgi:ATP-dependent RNA helicase RhlE